MWFPGYNKFLTPELDELEQDIRNNYLPSPDNNEHTRKNKVRELATVCLAWQHWTKALVWFDDVDISAFHSCVVVDLWQSLSEWHLRVLLSACVLVYRRENVGALIRATNEH